MTNEDKIIQLFESGRYQLAYSLRDSLNIEINYSKIDLCGMVMKLSEGNNIYITSKTDLEFEIEIQYRHKVLVAELDWIDIEFEDEILALDLKDHFEQNLDLLCHISGRSKGRVIIYNHNHFHTCVRDKGNITKIIKYFFEG